MNVDLKPAMIGCVSLSTAHIPKHTANGLDDADGTVSQLHFERWNEYGWIIWCDEDSANSVRDWHPELADLMDRCIADNVCFLQLDADAVTLEGLLPIFDW